MVFCQPLGESSANRRPNQNDWLNMKGNPCCKTMCCCDASRTALKLCLWNSSYVLYTLYSGPNSCSLCQQCHCKEPIFTRKVLCFDNVRFPPEFMSTFGSAGKMSKFHRRQQNVSCSQRGSERRGWGDTESGRTKACCIRRQAHEDKAWERAHNNVI